MVKAFFALRNKYGAFRVLFALLMKILKRPIVWAMKNFSSNKIGNGKTVLVFQSTPDYSDNCRALSEYLVANGFLERYSIYWCVSDPAKFKKMYPAEKVSFIPRVNDFNDFPLYVYGIFSKAKFFFGTHGFPITSKFFSAKQQCIMLWHGCSFKHASPLAKRKFFSKALVAGPIFLKTKAKYWKVSEESLIAKGYPRYDWLLKKSAKALEYVRELKSGCDKIVVWMPTFRNDKYDKYNECNEISSFPLMRDFENWLNVDEVCKKLGIVLVVKLHMFQKNYDIDFSKLNHVKMVTNEDFISHGIQMYEFLAVTDALLTDYSSVGIDYLVVDKPIAFTLDDFEAYKKLRGFVFDDPRCYMPGHHLYCYDDLIVFLKDVAESKDLYRDNRKKMKNVAVFDSVCYSREIVETLNM